MKKRYDVVVLGAGVIGSSIAMHLSQKGITSIAVVDPDLEGRWSSSELNAGGVRATFFQEINILLSRRSIEFFEKHSEEVGYRACGYLWMLREDKWKSSLEVRKKHETLGWTVEEWSPKQLKMNRPFIDKVDDLAGALFSPRDGLVNPNRLKCFFRDKARANGVQFLDRWALREARHDGNSWILKGTNPEEHLYRFLTNENLVLSPSSKSPSENSLDPLTEGSSKVGDPIEIWADQVVNATGAWASRVSKILGVDCPSKPIRRQICLFDSREVDLTPYGMIVDPSGVYFHPEATNGLAGMALPEPYGFDMNYDGAAFFEEHIWPALYERSSGFERLRHVTGWAGLYEVSPDETCILGRTEKPGLFDCHSFSGHGVMQAYAAGEVLANLMVGKDTSWLETSTDSRMGPSNSRGINPEALAVSRFKEGNLLPEKWVI